MKYWQIAFFDSDNVCVGDGNAYISEREAEKELAWLKKFGYPEFRNYDVRVVPCIIPEIKIKFSPEHTEEEEMKILKRYEMGWDSSRKAYKICWAHTLDEAMNMYERDEYDLEYPPIEEMDFDDEEDMYGYFESRANSVGADF